MSMTPEAPSSMIGRRGLLAGLLATPAIVRTPGLLMAVRPRAYCFTRTDLEQVMQQMLRMMAKDIEPALIEAMIFGGNGAIRTTTSLAGDIDVKFIPAPGIYQEFHG